MSRLEFIFRAVNALAGKQHEPITEHFLAEAIRLEVEIAKQEARAPSAAGAAKLGSSALEWHDHNAGHPQC